MTAFVVARGAFMVAARIGGFDPLSADAWSRWDSQHYVDIATSGYELFDCATIHFPRAGWCGNAGWFPAYPLLIGVLTKLGASATFAGALLAALFAIAWLVLLWNAFLDARLTRENVLTLLLAAFWPGAIYQHAVFPISMVTLTTLATMALALRGRAASAGIAGAIGAFSYSTAFLIAPVAAAATLLDTREPMRARLIRAAKIAGPIVLGFVAVLATHQVTVGAWDAFFKVQAKYGHGLHSPLSTLGHAISAGGTVPAVQAIFVAALVLLVLVLPRRERGAPREPWIAWVRILVATYWIFPLVMGNEVSLYRADTLLVSAVLLTRRLPFLVQVALVVIAIPLACAMASLFFEGAIV